MASMISISVFFLLSITYSLADDPSGNYCNQNIKSSQVSANIDHLLADTVTKFQNGATFVEASYGNGKDTIYGLAQCRSDVGPQDCLSCIQDAAQQVRKLCPSQSDGRIWYDFCFLRYSQDKFYGNVDTSTYGLLYKNTANVSDPDSFNQELGTIYDKIDSEAVKPSSKGFGKDKKKLSNFETLYALAQCTRDLSPLSCGQCLAIAIQNFEGFCKDSQGCRVLYSSCYVRYELYPFFFPFDDQTPKNKGRTIWKSIHHR